MKYIRYMLVLVLVLFIGLVKVRADETLNCYYIGDEFKARLEVFDNGKKHKVIVNKAGPRLDADSEKIMNWGHQAVIDYVATVPAYNEKKCPKYLILDYVKDKFMFIPYETYYIYGVEEKIALDELFNAMVTRLPSDINEIVYGTYLHSDGTPITREEYNGQIADPEFPINEDNCDPDDANYEECLKKQCGDIFGDKDDENSLAYIINKILGYVRVIVPILIIVLGSLDLARAVVAGKEDEMRKAQTTFIKRLIIGIVIFFVPVIVNLIMSFADMIWENYGSCPIKDIIE